MATTIPRDNHDENLEAFFIPRGASGRIDAVTLGRSNGHPFKRYPATGRPISIGPEGTNRFGKEDIDVDVHKGSGQIPVRNTRTVTPGKNNKIDGESGNTKGKTCICSILISVLVCCVLAEVLLQGSIMFLWRQSDFPLNIAYHRTPTTMENIERNLAEYALRFEPSKFKERVLQEKQMMLRSRLTQQNYLRPPHIALVCSLSYCFLHKNNHYGCSLCSLDL